MWDINKSVLVFLPGNGTDSPNIIGARVKSLTQVKIFQVNLNWFVFQDTLFYAEWIFSQLNFSIPQFLRFSRNSI